MERKDFPEWGIEMRNNSLLSIYEKDPAKTVGDQMFKTTLRTEDGVSCFLAFIQQKREKEDDSLSISLPSIGKWEPESTPFGSIHYVIKVGTSLEGHRGFLHGGFMSALMDEITGFTSVHFGPEKETFTGTLTVKYLNPVSVPSWLYGRSWIEKKEGRKRHVVGIIGDGNGKVYATSHVVFVEKERSKL